MPLSENQIEQLGVPLDPALVKVHPQTKARYLDGKHYIETANRIFGYGGWQFRILSAPTKATEGNRKNGTYYALWTVMGELSVDHAPAFVDVGTCEQNGDGPEATDMAMKGAVTDSLKRCLRNFGDQFGLVLYDKDLSRAQMEAELAAYQGKHAQEAAAVAATDAGENAIAPGEMQEPVAHVDRETGGISSPAVGPKQGGTASPDARVQAVLNAMARQIPEWARGDAVLAKEAAAAALNARPAELNKDVLHEYIAAWLDQKGNSPAVFAGRYQAHFSAEQKRRAAREEASAG